jgi:DNA-binding transcriptional LysR family regulator
VIDLWRRLRGDERDDLAVRGRLVSETRDCVQQAVLAGQGVGRFADLSVWPQVQRGELQPVIANWDSSDATPFGVLCRADARRDPAAQGCVALLEELLREVESQCQRPVGARPQTARPAWYGRRQ